MRVIIRKQTCYLRRVVELLIGLQIRGERTGRAAEVLVAFAMGLILLCG